MEIVNLIQVDPQPRGLDNLWPDDKSPTQWWQVCNVPEDYYPGQVEDGDEVTVTKEDDGFWYWVIWPGEEKCQTRF